ncbi:MAG TPA: VWA domain-containing protein [Acidobacteriaceae bacterium]
MRLLLVSSACLLALCLAGGQALHAQAAPSPDAPPSSSAPPPADEDQDGPVTTLKVQTSLVSLYFTVKDKRGGLVPTMTQQDCTVFENKEPQKLRSFAAEANQPLTLGILLDTSGSQTNVLQMEQQTGGAFLKRILRQKDEAFLISFDVDVNLLQDYTSNASRLARAMEKAEINTAGGNGSAGIPGIGQGPVPTQGAPKGTLLYDAVYLASGDKLRTETGRKALILLTDGEDEGSRYKIQQAIEAAQKANAIIYVLLIADRGVYAGSMMGYTGASAMRKLTEETGGRMIDVGNNGRKMEDAFAQIEAELRTQYVATYTPANQNMDGSYRPIAVQCKGDGLKVQVRKGYYALPSDGSQ